MCGGGVRSILLLPLVARCIEPIDVCIWRMFVFISVVVTVWGSVGMFGVSRPLVWFEQSTGCFVWISVRLFCFVQSKTLCMYSCIYFLAELMIVCVDVILMSSG